MLLVAAVLHGIAAPVVWLLVVSLVENSGLPSELVSVVYAIAAIGVVAQLVFAATSGLGAYLLYKGGPNVASVGTGLLVMGIIAVVFSIVVSGGILGIAGGALTAYAGNKARKRPPPMWMAPPGSWMPPPSTPPP